MRCFRQVALYSALLALAQAPIPVQAEVRATAQIGGFVVELIDRRPDDGIAPTLTLVGGRSFIQGVSFSGGDLWAEGQRYSAQPFGDISATYATVHERVSVRVIGGDGPPWTSTTLLAQGALEGLSASGTPRYFSGLASSNGDFFDAYSLLLSPWTSVSIRAVATLSLSKTVGEMPAGEGGESGWAQASLYMLGEGIENGRSADLRLSTGDAAQSLERLAELRAGASNFSDDYLPLRFRASVLVDGVGQYAPVPEPSQAALLLAGLLALARLGRRRQTSPAETGQSPT